MTLRASRTAAKGTSTGSRGLARLSLGLMAAALSVIVMVSPSFGAVVVLAQESPTPTPTPSATGPAEPTIQLLNPSLAYDAFEGDTAEISDRFDGVDERYHVLAFVANAPSNVVIELSVDAHRSSSPDCEILFCNDPAEETIGLMEPVSGSPGLYEFFWDVPADYEEPNNTSDFFARLYEVSGDTEQLAEDFVQVDVGSTEETAELTFPTNGGQLGFYKGRGGAWRAVVDGSMSTATTQQMRVFYTTSALSQEPTYTNCNTTNFTRGPAAGTTSRNVRLICTLQGSDTPSKLTAIAFVPYEDDNPQERCAPSPGPCPGAAVTDELMTIEAGDVHRVTGFAQTPGESTVLLVPSPTGEQPAMGRALADNQCMTFLARVRDQFDRPVLGANVDVHLQGPHDTAGFGADTGTSTANNSSEDKAPDKGPHNGEPSWDCDFTSTDDRGPRTQGDTNVPAGNDIKHIESVQGSGLSGGGSVSFGEIRFHIRSQRVGFTDLTAWIDDEELATESGNRDLDDDIQETSESFDTFRAQWYVANPTIQFEPTGGTGLIGTCQTYVARVRSGSAAVPGINVDIHATGPDNELDFCDPEGGSERRAPDQPAAGSPNAHDPEEEDEASHTTTGSTPRTQHTEGETDDSGNFVFGVTSPTSGDTTIFGWIDREPGFDNDVQDSSEAGTTASQTWGTSAADATVRFLNPSGYGSGEDVISDKQDADARYHLVARTDAADVLPSGVEFLISADGTTFTSLGMGTRVGSTDAYELLWDSSTTPDGTYTLRVQIPGTSKLEDREVLVNNEDTDPSPNPPPAPPSPGDITAETVELSKPANGESVTFTRRSTPVTGTASAGSSGVEIYYTTTAANTVRTQSSWTLCGSVALPTGTAPQTFSTECDLAAAHQATMVTGIAAIALDCEELECDGDILTESYNSGDAHRVFGMEANPLVSVEPAEVETEIGECERFILRVFDQTGQGMSGQNVDVHVTGPSDEVQFCDPGDGSNRSAPGEGSHSAGDTETGVHEDAAGPNTKHTEGTTNTSGRFIFGVRSDVEGDSSILGWVDNTENDQQDAGENSDTSTIHWVGKVGGGGGGSDRCTIRGTQGDDELEGTSGDDVICARGGDDVIRAKGGNDIVRAGFGKDVVRGGSGSDNLQGRQGSDKVFGGKGADTLKGGRGNDRLDGGPGRQDTCSGGPGRDTLRRCE